uniref:DUF38 domain-containing protein n=1 Tax=Panagrolaimus davidi TaxID=227884 RepID=A0A914PF41_9BILA
MESIVKEMNVSSNASNIPSTFINGTLNEESIVFENGNEFKIEKLPNNFGISGILTIEHEILLPQLIPKIIVCDLNALILKSRKIFFDHFKFLTSSENLKELELHSTIVCYRNREIVPYEIILDSIPSLRSLQMNCIVRKNITEEFIEKFSETKLEKLSLCELPISFQFEKFLDAMRWESPGLDIHFDFKRSFLMYEKINIFIGKLLVSKECHCYPPFFEAYLQRPNKNIYYFKF